VVTLALGAGFLDLDRKGLRGTLHLINGFGLEMIWYGSRVGEWQESLASLRRSALPASPSIFGIYDLSPVLAKRSASCLTEALPFQGGSAPSRSFKDVTRMPQVQRFGCIRISTGARRCALRARPAKGSGRSGRQTRLQTGRPPA
jgi:hypothetical protein